MSSFNSECPNCGKPVQTDDETGSVMEACCPWCDYAFYESDVNDIIAEFRKEFRKKKKRGKKKKKKESVSVYEETLHAFFFSLQFVSLPYVGHRGESLSGFYL